MEKERLISETMHFVEEKLKGEGSGHDWWHIYRVYNNALNIAKDEGNADLFVIRLAALLHDIADWKFNNGDHLIGADVAKRWLTQLQVDDKIIEHVEEIIRDISFKGSGEKSLMKSIEGKIVQDADRLDAIGAIGIGRAFAYGGYAQREMHNPTEKPLFHKTFEEYKQSRGTTINHFYEKLLSLKDLMNTNSAKKLAEKRDKFMRIYLKHFYEEWNGF